MPPSIYVDSDACPVREEVFRVAERLGLDVHVVSNGARGLRLPEAPYVHRVIVPAGADAADDWIASHVGPGDICVTADIPLAARCLAAGAQAVSPTGHRWTDANIGNALAGRAVSQHLREIGAASGGPAAITKADRSRFLSELDAACTAARRPPRPRAPGPGIL